MKFKNIVMVIVWMVCGRGYAQSFPADLYRHYNNLPLAYMIDPQQIRPQNLKRDFVTQIVIGDSEVQVYKENEKDCGSESEDCIFYYTPFFYVDRDSDQQMAITLDSSNDRSDFVSVTLRNRDLEVEHMILEKLNSMFGKTFQIESLRVVPLSSIEIEVVTTNKELTSSQRKFVTLFSPNPTADYQAPMIADQILKFELSKEKSLDFVKKLRRSLKVNITYTWQNLRKFDESADENDQKKHNQSTTVRFDIRKNIPLLLSK